MSSFDILNEVSEAGLECDLKAVVLNICSENKWVRSIFLCRQARDRYTIMEKFLKIVLSYKDDSKFSSVFDIRA